MTSTRRQPFHPDERAAGKAVSRRNAEFYTAFPYPWPAASFSKLDDRAFGSTFLNQELGYFGEPRITPRSIWVAGCGTNQAVLMALQFPDAEVLGTDLSEASLAFARKSSEQLGIDNLSLARLDLQESTAEGRFDFVVCTGVIHHNQDPDLCLRRLGRALTPTGVLELMVYNQHHRWLTGAYQEAIRTLVPGADFEEQLAVTRQLMGRFPAENSMKAFLTEIEDFPAEVIADTLLQPVEHTFTVPTLRASIEQAGLRMLLPRPNAIDALEQRSWNALSLADDGVLERYVEALDDADRWSVISLLMAEVSPMLWFYVDRMDSPIPRLTERQICDDFLQTRFTPYRTSATTFTLQEQRYVRADPVTQFPRPQVPADAVQKSLWESSTGTRTISQLMTELGLPQSFGAVNDLRMNLTNLLRPYLLPPT